jgi:hypothetical protein
MGSGVVLMNEEDMDHHPSEIKKLLNDKEKCDELFTTIAKSIDPNSTTFNAASVINIRNLVTYFRNEFAAHPLLQHIIPDKEVILTAHKHVCSRIREMARKKPGKNAARKRRSTVSMLNKEDVMVESISRENFKFLMATLYLYGHIWKLFHIIDEQVISDLKVTKEEFIMAKGKLAEIKFISRVDLVSEKDWADGYDCMDVNQDGVISFEEMCMYAISKMHIQPTDFLKYGECTITGEKDSDDDDDDLDLVDQIAKNLLKVESTTAAVDRMEEEQQAREDALEALKEPIHLNRQRDLVAVEDEEHGIHKIYSVSGEILDKHLDAVIQTAYLKDELAHIKDRKVPVALNQVAIVHMQTTSELFAIKGVSGLAFNRTELTLTSPSGSTDMDEEEEEPPHKPHRIRSDEREIIML